MDDFLLCLAGIACYIKLRNQTRRRKRKCWVKPLFQKRQVFSHIRLINELEAPNFYNYLRMNKMLYDKLLNLVTPKITKLDTVMRRSISADERLKVTLRYLATGRSFTDLQYSSIISKQELSKIIPETCAAIYQALKDEYMKIGTLHDLKVWQLNNAPIQDGANIAIHVTPPDGEEDDEFAPQAPPPRLRRKLSTPLVSLLPGAGAPDYTMDIAHHRYSGGRSMSALDRTRRRFSTMVSTGAAAAVSRRLSATIGWLAAPAQVKPQIVRQGRALCMQYIRCQIRRSSIVSRKIVMKRLQRMLETECGEEAANNYDSGVLAALRALCAALERKRPDAFRHVARQATRAPSAMLRSDTALAELALALARRITRDNITWSKIAAVFCICGALAREAAEASDGEPSVELVAAPAAAIADLLHEEPGSWVAANGGWNGLLERLRASERDQRSERTLRMFVSVFALVCFTLLLLRWVLHAPAPIMNASHTAHNTHHTHGTERE